MRTKITSNNCANQKLRTKIITKTEKCKYALILKNPAGIGINLTFVLKCHLSRVLFYASILWGRQIQFFPFCIRTPPDWVWWRCATEPRAMADPLPEFRCSTPRDTGSPLDDRLKKSKKWTLKINPKMSIEQKSKKWIKNLKGTKSPKWRKIQHWIKIQIGSKSQKWIKIREIDQNPKIMNIKKWVQIKKWIKIKK